MKVNSFPFSLLRWKNNHSLIIRGRIQFTFKKYSLQRETTTRVHIVKAMVFPVIMYGCESWTVKKTEHQRIDTFEFWCRRTLESPLDSKEIKPVSPKGNQPWIFIRRTDTEAPIFWPPDAKRWLFGKDPESRKGWGQEEKGATEDEMVGWHHRLSGHEFEQALVDRGQRSPACMGPQSAGYELATEQQGPR